MKSNTEYLDEFLALNTQITKERVGSVRIFETDTRANGQQAEQHNATNAYCSLVWERDEGAYAIMRATQATTIIVTNTHNGRYVSEGFFNLGRGDTIRLLQNNDGRNYDGYRC